MGFVNLFLVVDLVCWVMWNWLVCVLLKCWWNCLVACFTFVDVNSFDVLDFVLIGGDVYCYVCLRNVLLINWFV